MKKVLAIAAVLMFMASTAHAVPATGTQMIGAAGSISLKPDAAKNIYLSGMYGKFWSDGIFAGGGLSIAKWNGVDDPSVDMSLVAQYWMGLSDGLDMFAGLNVGVHVMPSPLDITAGVDIGVAHWLADNTALTVYADVDLGSVKDFNSDALTANLVIGVAQFF